MADRGIIYSRKTIIRRKIDMALHIIDEANRCLNCKKPMCQQGCPVHTPVPQIIQMFKENRLMEAGERLFENNPDIGDLFHCL